jgi:hypothetical protein
MTKFSFYQSSRAVLNNDLDESIEVEVEVTPDRESYSSLTVSCIETSGSMRKSCDSDDRATDIKLSGLEASGKKASADEGEVINLLSPPTEETTFDSWPSASSSECQENAESETLTCDEEKTDAIGRSEDKIGSVVTMYLEREIVSSTEDEDHEVEGIKNNCVDDVNASSEDHEDELMNATEKGLKVEGIADECVVVVNANEESKDETENVGVCRPVASSDKLADMMRYRIQAINGIRDVLVREREQGMSSHYVDQFYLL